MKTIGATVFVFVLMASLAFAAGQGVHEPGTGIADPELQEAGQGTGQGLGNGTQTATATQQQNQGAESQIQNQVQGQQRLVSGQYTTENGEQVQVQEQANNRVRLQTGEAAAETGMQMNQEQVQEKTKLSVKLSNGQDAEVKVMPNTASERALERLGLKVCSAENGCTIELKEVGSGSQTRAAYEVQLQKQAKVLGLFKTKMQVQAQVDAENGEVLKVHKPWWAFLASETEE